MEPSKELPRAVERSMQDELGKCKTSKDCSSPVESRTGTLGDVVQASCIAGRECHCVVLPILLVYTVTEFRSGNSCIRPFARDARS